jgi:hypothetical protein
MINYRTVPDWGSKVLDLTDGEGVDHVLSRLAAAARSINPCGPSRWVDIFR